MWYHHIAANMSMQKCKKAHALFNTTKFTLPDEHAAPFNLITIPKPYFIHDTDSLQNSVLELIQNIEVGDYKNVYEAKHKLSPDCMLPANFGQNDLYLLIKNFECETSSLLKVKNATLSKLRELLNAPLDQLEQFPSSAEDLEVMHTIL